MFRVIHCTTAADVAFERAVRRRQQVPTRQAHADPGPCDVAESALRHRAFERLSMDCPSIEVDTTAGYRPGLGQIVAFANGGIDGR